MHLGGGADCADGEDDAAGPRRQSNSGTSDVFSKINSRLGNFDGVSEKEGGGVGVEDRRVRPSQSTGISHSRSFSSFLLPPFLPAYFFLCRSSTILSLLTFATHNYSTAIATAPHRPPTTTVTTARPITTRLEQLFHPVRFIGLSTFPPSLPL